MKQKYNEKVILKTFSKESGELLCDIELDSPKLSIIEKNEGKILELQYVRAKLVGGGFVKMLEGKGQLLKDQLSIEAIGVAILLMDFINYDDGRLIKPNGSKLQLQDIYDLVGKSSRTTKRYMAELYDKKVIAKKKFKNGTYYVFNPFICFKGTNIDLSLIEMFSDSVWNTIR